MPSLIFDDANLISVFEGLHPRRCVACGDFTHKFDGPFSSRKKPKKDVSTSTEGIYVISPRLKEFLTQNGVGSVVYHSLESGFHIPVPAIRVTLDLSGCPNARHARYCHTCGRFDSFTKGQGTEAIMAGQPEIDPMGIARTAQWFSSNRQQSFTIVVGDRLAIELIKNEFSGMFLKKIAYGN